MGKIEVKLSVEGNPEGGGDKNDEVVSAGGGLIIRHEGDPESKLVKLQQQVIAFNLLVAQQ